MRLVLLAGFLLGCGGTSPAPAPSPAPHAGHHAEHHAGHHAAHAAMPHRFEDAEAWAKVFDDPERDRWQEPDRVLAALELSPGMTVADIGAGTGYFAVRLARAVPSGRVIATDVEPDMVRYMTERATREGLANLTAVATPPDDPQLAPGSVDRVLVVDVWHHLGDRRDYARRLAAALRPGGLIAVVDFQLDATRGPPRQHRLAPDVIVDELRAAGLDAQLAPVELPEQYVVIARRKG